MRITLIAAVARNGVIGQGNALAWRLRDDLRFFAQRTREHHIIMGRKTYESIGRPLPDRENIVVSRDAHLRIGGCQVAPSLEQALSWARATGESEAFIAGGAQIYALALPMADSFYRTRILADVPGDALFPPFDESEWGDAEELSRHQADERNEHPCVRELLTRKEGKK